jgi:predicted nucleic-acid-binding protein
MRALDTNVIVRYVTNDHACQAAATLDRSLKASPGFTIL